MENKIHSSDNKLYKDDSYLLGHSVVLLWVTPGASKEWSAFILKGQAVQQLGY